MTILVTETYESGSSGQSLPGSSLGTTVPGGTYDNTHAARGALAGKFAATSSQDSVRQYSHGSTYTPIYGRAYFYLTANPSGNTRLITGLSSVDHWSIGINSSGKIIVGKTAASGGAFTVSTTGTTSVSLNTWVRLEWTTTMSGGTTSQIVHLYNSDNNTITESISGSFANTGTGTTDTYIGVYDAVNYTAWVDEIEIKTTNWIGKSETDGRTLLSADFEAGTSGSTVATTDQGSNAPWDGVTITSPDTLTYSNTHAFSGSNSSQITYGNTYHTSSPVVKWDDSLPTLTRTYGRIYGYFTANPAAKLRLVSFVDSNGTLNASIRLSSSGKILVGHNAAGASNTDASSDTVSSTSVALNQWIRLEWEYICAGNGQLTVRLFNTATALSATETITYTGASSNQLGSNVDRVYFGNLSSFSDQSITNYSWWIDNIVISDYWPGGSTSYTEARVTGQSSSNRTQDTRITGYNTSNTTQNVKVTGQASSSLTQSVRVTGQSSSSTTQSIRATGKLTSVGPQQPVRATGLNFSNIIFDARITGYSTSSCSYDARITGANFSATSYGARVTGQAVSSATQSVKTVAQATSNSTTDVRITGSSFSSATQDTRAVGQTTSSTSQNVRLKGQSSSNTTYDVRATGASSSSVTYSIKTSGTSTSNIVQGVRVTGKSSSNTTQDIRITGQAASNSTQDIRTAGKTVSNTTYSIRVTGKATSNSTQDTRVTGYLFASNTDQAVKVAGSNGPITLMRNIGTYTSRTSGSSATVTIPSVGVTAGTRLIIRVSHTSGNDVSGATDSRGNSYNIDVPSTYFNAVGAAILSAHVTAPLISGDTITISWVGNVQTRVVSIDQWQGIAAIDALDRTASAGDHNFALTSGTTAATTAANELVVGSFALDPNGDTIDFHAGAGYTELPEVTTGTSGNDRTLAGEYKVTSITGTQTATGST